ncbi:serine hydrolase domain-containing protein [Isobaculum melis]|uniref:CubicO group peptidase, beta-lactamase class C family n=1 Tax=Isobaculum melis TaxID=142588 RepID=A0A1H9SUX6_9LACT|nr:serine hydrolase domain-containing protein [Isobaculum melis]SER88698.1 CubicO group peptidase, beta-lactamase class C family [Isobaculum melis]
MYPKTEQIINRMLAEQTIPGVSFSFIKGKESQQFHHGWASLYPNKEPLKPKMQYDVASLTKVICTTTRILQLWEAQKIQLDTPINQILTTFQDPRITIRHLLTHTSDIDGFIPNRDQLTAQELKQAILALKGGTAVGEKMKYTDTGFILLGFIIEELTGETVWENAEKHVLKPLHMEESTFQPKEQQQCIPTENHAKRGLIRGVVHDPKAYTLKEHCGSAGLFTTLDDIEVFIQQVFFAIEPTLLKRATIEGLVHDFTPTGTNHRSLGWIYLPASTYGTAYPTLMHTGYTGTFIVLDILKQEAFIFLSNRVHPSANNQRYLENRSELVQTYLKEKEQH